MNDVITLDARGVLTAPDTLTIRRRLPGPIERVWDYLTRSELRRRWLAAGDMDGTPGSSFELTWRNDELTDPPGKRPDGFAESHSMTSRIITFDPPHHLAFTWGAQQTGEVSFTLEPVGKEVLLTLVHRRLPEGEMRLNIQAGWHAHLDLLVADATGGPKAPHWDTWSRLRQDYAARPPA